MNERASGGMNERASGGMNDWLVHALDVGTGLVIGFSIAWVVL